MKATRRSVSETTMFTTHDPMLRIVPHPTAMCIEGFLFLQSGVDRDTSGERKGGFFREFRGCIQPVVTFG